MERLMLIGDISEIINSPIIIVVGVIALVVIALIIVIVSSPKDSKKNNKMESNYSNEDMNYNQNVNNMNNVTNMEQVYRNYDNNINSNSNVSDSVNNISNDVEINTVSNNSSINNSNVSNNIGVNTVNNDFEEVKKPEIEDNNLLEATRPLDISNMGLSNLQNVSVIGNNSNTISNGENNNTMGNSVRLNNIEEEKVAPIEIKNTGNVKDNKEMDNIDNYINIDDIASKIDNVLNKEVVKEPAISNKDFWNEDISSKIDDPVVVDDLQINKNREEEIEKNLGIDDLNRNTISFNNMFEATQKISVDDILEASKR